MSSVIKNIFRLVVFILIQVYVLNQIPPLHQYVIPYLYYLPLLWLPFSISRQWLLIIGFLTGLTLDFFTMQIGVHAAACTLVVYLRPFVINVITPKDTSEFFYREPSPQALRWAPYMIYIGVLTVAHHTYMTFLQWLQFGSFWGFLIKIFTTTAISLLLIFLVELLFPRRLRFRTNTA